MKPVIGHLLNLLPKRPAQVVSMQSAKGVMSTWDEVRPHVYYPAGPQACSGSYLPYMHVLLLP